MSISVIGVILLILSCGAVFTLSAFGICHAFRKCFASLSLSDTASPHLLPILGGQLSICPRNHLKAGLRTRVFLWPSAVTLITLSASLASTRWKAYRDFLLEGLLPHYYFVLTNSLNPNIRAAIMMCLVYGIIRSPRTGNKFDASEPSFRVSTLSKIIGFYYWLRDLFLDEVVFWGKRNQAIVDFALDLKKQWLAPARIQAEKVKDVITTLAQLTGQPENGSEHQIILGCLERIGAPRLIQELKGLLQNPRIETRRKLMVNVVLKKPEADVVLQASATRVGFVDWFCVQSMDVEVEQGESADGVYRIESLGGRRMRSNIMVELRTDEHDCHHLLVSPPSRRLGGRLRPYFVS